MSAVHQFPLYFLVWGFVAQIVVACKPPMDASEVLDIGSQRRDCSSEGMGGTPFPSYYKLKELYQTKPEAFQNKQTFLQLLPESFRSNFLLFYHTESLDDADFVHPRIVFTGDPDQPRFMVAMAGHSERQTVEIIEFNEKKARFCFRDIELRENRPPIFKDQPTSCFGCHKRDSRPNWEPHNVWPRVYGSRDGTLGKDSVEHQGLKSFERDSRSAGIFQSLKGPANLTIETNGVIRFINQKADHAAYTPHARFTTGLVKLNNQRIARLATEFDAEHQGRYKRALLGSFLACSDVEKLLPTSVVERFSETISSIIQKTKIELEDVYSRLEAQTNEVNQGTSESMIHAKLDLTDPDYIQAIANLRYVLESGGSSIFDWSMSIEDAPLFASQTMGITDAGYWFYKKNFPDQKAPFTDPDLFNVEARKTKYGPADLQNVCDLLSTL